MSIAAAVKEALRGRNAAQNVITTTTTIGPPPATAAGILLLLVRVRDRSAWVGWRGGRDAGPRANKQKKQKGPPLLYKSCWQTTQPPNALTAFLVGGIGCDRAEATEGHSGTVFCACQGRVWLQSLGLPRGEQTQKPNNCWVGRVASQPARTVPRFFGHGGQQNQGMTDCPEWDRTMQIPAGAMWRPEVAIDHFSRGGQAQCWILAAAGVACRPT